MSAHLKPEATGRHSLPAQLGRHSAPSTALSPAPSRARHRRVAIACGIGLATFAAASPAMLAQGGEVASPARGSEVLASTGAAGSTLSLPACEGAVTILLGDDLGRVATGRPDLGPDSSAGVAASLGGTATSAMERVQQVHDDLVGVATADLINRYQLNVPALLVAYRPRITGACLSVLAS